MYHRKKIAIINQRYWVPDGLIHLPLDLAYIVSVLKQEWHDVKVFDMVFWDVSYEQLDVFLSSFTPTIVIWSTVTKSYANILEVMKRVKYNNKNTLTILTWEHVTFISEEVLTRHPYIDVVTIFESEYIVRDIANEKNYSDILWISYRGEWWQIIKNNSRPAIVDLDTLPFPDRKAFPLDKYIKHDFETTVQTTRWCYKKCKFCLRTVYGRVLRIRKMENVIEEIKEVLSLWFKRIFFLDDTFTFSRQRVLHYCDLIKKNNLKFKWACNARVDNIISEDESIDELLQKMAESWCYRLFLWLESGSDDVLMNVDKWITKQDIEKAINKIRKYGIEVHGSFALWMIWDTRASIKKTVEFAKILHLDMISFNLMTPYPGTDIYNHRNKYKISIENPYWYEEVDRYKHPIAWIDDISAKELVDIVKMAYLNYLT